MKFGDKVKVLGGFFEGYIGKLVDAKFHAGDGSYSYLVLFTTSMGEFERLIVGCNLEKVD